MSPFECVTTKDDGLDDFLKKSSFPICGSYVLTNKVPEIE